MNDNLTNYGVVEHSARHIRFTGSSIPTAINAFIIPAVNISSDESVDVQFLFKEYQLTDILFNKKKDD